MLIDNFSSMRRHKDKLLKTARVISYVAKVADKNSMDLYFTSDTTRPIKCSSSTEIESTIKKTRSIDGTCNMTNCLHDILQSILLPCMRATSIYVYTDGVWEPGNPDVDSVIKRSIRHLADKWKPQSTLMFQFIQFGNDREGGERLRHLDDDCKETHYLGE